VTEPSRQSGSDPIGDLQRWLVRSGARSVTRQMRGQIRTALGGGKQQHSTANVWETATSEADEAPECAWCPICRARRRLRESGPGLSSGVGAAADAVGAVMQDAMSAFEAAVAAAGRPARPQDTTAPPAGEVWDEATDEPAVRTRPRPRPPANGGTARPAGPRPAPAAPNQPSAEAKNPPAAAKHPSAEAKPSAAWPKQPSAGTGQPSSGAKQPAAWPKQPSAGTGQPTSGAKQPAAEAQQPSAGPKKPAAGPKKPAGRPGGPAAADRPTPDEPTTTDQDKPTS
jgi:hypothetical protein